LRVTVEYDDDEERRAVYVFNHIAAMIGTGIEDKRKYKNSRSISNIYHVFVDKLKKVKGFEGRIL